MHYASKDGLLDDLSRSPAPPKYQPYMASVRRLPSNDHWGLKARMLGYNGACLDAQETQ
jgi:hypothetical protein